MKSKKGKGIGLENRLKRKNYKRDLCRAEIEALGTDETPKTKSVNPFVAIKRRRKPSMYEHSNKNKQRRRKETIFLCSVIRGETVNNKLPIINDMFDSLTCILKPDESTGKALNLKAIITNSIIKKCADK